MSPADAMQTTRAVKVWRAVTLLLVGAVAMMNVIYIGGKVPPPSTSEAPDEMLDYVTRCERRFAAFRQHVLERGLNGTIGYIEDAQPAETFIHDIDADYFIAQFALVPLLLDSTLGQHEWALGNFRTSSQQNLPAGWVIAHDFGRGVLLLRKSIQ